VKTYSGYGAVPPDCKGSTVTVRGSGSGSVSLSPGAIRSINQMELTGDDADIIIKGRSLNQTLRSFEQRLNMLIPNPQLEMEWAQLRALGEQYRALETELETKAQMWRCLNATQG